MAAAWRSPERQRADPAGNRSPRSERPTGATQAKSGEPLPTLLPQAVEQACARWPQRPALVDTDGSVCTFDQLERRSRRLAARLAASGGADGARVGVWMAKSSRAVVSLVAALRAGAIYVPLDRWAPAERTESLAADAGLAVLLTDARGAASARAWAHPPAAIWPDPEPEAAADPPLPPLRATAADTAYILYTSGSTGVPKGVMLSHAHALNFITWAAQESGLEPGDRVASHAPFHFDLSIFDLWAALSHGAAVCLLDPVCARFPRAVADWITARRINVWYSVPSALVQLLPYASQAAPGLRDIMFAGEVFPPPALHAWRRAAPQARFHNWYGPTETNVCTHLRLPQPDRESTAIDPLPIGRACPNFQLAIWNDPGEAVPPGGTGFLWACGPGIFNGYWGDLSRTRDVIFERQGTDGRLERWYNTGDLVRQDPGGLFYFLGRRDHLVKCRGYRVSLLEIERTLESCAGVQRAVVIATPDPNQATGLHAFVMAASGVLTAAALRRHVACRLPGYMVPDEIDVRECLPETSNGKVDRQRLQAAARAAAPPA